MTEVSVEGEYLMYCFLLIVCFTNCLSILSRGSLPFFDPAKSAVDSSIMHDMNSLVFKAIRTFVEQNLMGLYIVNGLFNLFILMYGLSMCSGTISHHKPYLSCL